VTARPVSRATFLTGLIGLGALAAAPEAHAARNADAENYVQQNATAALAALGNTSISSAQRQQQFHRLMMQFADMDAIAAYVVGRYSGALRADPALRRDWYTAFQDFAIATYEDQFENMDGAAVRVVGSVENTPGRDVTVDSRVRPPHGDQMRLQWRVLRSGNGWKVRDVGVGPDGVWLAQVQQRQFLAQLDTNRGDLRALITDIRARTASMRQRILARS
jgi:phospholipid transport system substrate-binding protein